MRWIHDISRVLPTNGPPQRRDPSAIDTVVLHCTAMVGWNVWETARYHTGPNHISEDGCPTIAYAYFVEEDGLAYRCLDDDVRAWHVGPWNDRAVGVCMAYEACDEPPPDEQLNAAVDVCTSLVRRLGLSPDRVLGHRELEGTGFAVEDGEVVLMKECPGRSVDMEDFRCRVADALARPAGHEVEVA